MNTEIWVSYDGTTTLKEKDSLEFCKDAKLEDFNCDEIISDKIYTSDEYNKSFLPSGICRDSKKSVRVIIVSL